MAIMESKSRHCLSLVVGKRAFACQGATIRRVLHLPYSKREAVQRARLHFESQQESGLEARSVDDDAVTPRGPPIHYDLVKFNCESFAERCVYRAVHLLADH